MGFTALGEIGAGLGMQVDTDPDPDSDIALSFEEFYAAVDQLLAVGFPVERDAAEARGHTSGVGVSTMRAWLTGWLAGLTRCRPRGPALAAGRLRRWQYSDLSSGRRGKVAPRGSGSPMGQRAQVKGPR